MSSFSAHWLSLREPVDHAARNQQVQSKVIEQVLHNHQASDKPFKVLDLGCGSGSNLRALGPKLGLDQNWTLVDYDADLLAHARQTISHWADRVLEDSESTLIVQIGNVGIRVRFVVLDLNQAIEDLLKESFDLVTAAALFDLVSQSWVDRFVASLNSPLYVVLNFDGQMRWHPAHALDERVCVAFDHHQQTDKGFGGPALGPQASAYLQKTLHQRGYQSLIGSSPWVIDAAHRDLHAELMRGIASAAGETGQLGFAEIEQWHKYHEHDDECVIGHIDLYAAKPRG